MKLGAAAAVVGTALLLAGCTSHAAGAGGSPAAGTCSAPQSLAGCGTCASQSDCESCASAFDQAGVSAYNALLDCIECTACYTTCAGSADTHCTGAPATTDACDTGVDCGTCQTCAVKATCADELTACKAVPECVDLVQSLYSTCSPLPM